MRRQIEAVPRYIVTPETAEHRLFVWLRCPVIPDKNLIVVPRDDDTAFGILQSRFHEAWSTAFGNRMGKGNQRRYNNSTTFETFPFPEGLTPDIPASAYADDPRAQAIAAAAAELNRLREAWLNPPDLVRREPEVVPGYPDRILPVDAKAAEILKKRTLTNLYNARPAWLDQAHARLDAAVADAYGWAADWRAGRLGDDEILARLFALNQARAAAQGRHPEDAPARLRGARRLG
jgi:type II restriction/modification system DNA methylase subunit YeeA